MRYMDRSWLVYSLAYVHLGCLQFETTEHFAALNIDLPLVPSGKFLKAKYLEVELLCHKLCCVHYIR